MIFLISTVLHAEVVATSLIEEISEEIFMPFTVGGVNTLHRSRLSWRRVQIRYPFVPRPQRNPRLFNASRFEDNALLSITSITNLKRGTISSTQMGDAIVAIYSWTILSAKW